MIYAKHGFIRIVALLLVTAPTAALAQHEGHQPTKTKTPTKAPAAKAPAAKAPATKAPATKAPATKAPPTKTKAATTTKTKAPATKAATKASTTSEVRIPVSKDSVTSDSAHVHPPDSTVAKRDTVHVHRPDTASATRDTTHAHAADSTVRRDSAHAHVPSAATTLDTMPMPMPMDGALGISMERSGSGTTWIPDAVFLPSRHWMKGKWMVMLHGFLFVQHDEEGGPRGASQFGSLNWAMLMADRPLAGGKIQLRFMPSLDPATVGKCGYPMLLQSGETCNGEPLVDRQHPHDFFMELGALYERPISSNLAFHLYAAPAGEPALGPVAFMHRPSAMDEPKAPLGHHWQDATHISFGVVTAGLFTRKVRLEASAFNGHEPDEERWGIDPLDLNSYSGRLTINPTRNWSLTAGYGKLDNPERDDPPHSVRRFVASALHGRGLGTDGQWASTVVYGRNQHEGEDPSHSALAESEVIFDRHNTLFGRAEWVQKSAHDLQLSAFPDEQLFAVSAVSLGYIRELMRGRGVTIGLGARGTVNFVPSELEAPYGSRNPVGGMVFLRLRPSFSKAPTTPAAHEH